MARLPTKDDLSQPGSLRSGRMISSADTSAIGRGLEALGSGIAAFGEKQKQQQNAVDLARAEALKTQRFLDLQNQFDQDGDYSTFGQRAGDGTRKAVSDAANLIRDPKMRERYAAQSQIDAIRTNDSIIDKGRALRQQAETNALDEALELNRRLYVDPLVPEDVKAKARNEIIGAIDVSREAGLLTPDQADARKKKYVDGADVSRAELADPSIILGTQAPSAGYGDPRLPAGMRNNNPGNIKYVGQGESKGVVGPSENTDQGDPQAVFATPEAGMREAYRLARSKYDGGKTTANTLIAGDGGWTPGNTQAAANIAASMGLGPDDDLKLGDPVQAQKFMRALVTQEHGPASKAYSDDMIRTAVAGGAETSTGKDFPIITKGNSLTGRRFAPDLNGVRPEVLTRFQQLQNSFGASVPVVSGFRDPERNAQAGGAKKSRHIQGDALDLDVSNLSTEQRVDLIRKARAAGFAGIGVYPNSIHIDTGAPRAWGPSFSRNSLPAWAQEAVNAPLGSADASSATPRSMPDYWSRLSPEDQARIIKVKQAEQNQRNAETRAGIEVTADNAPTAILNTGKYDGQLPSLEQFQTAYGPVDGAERYGKFQASVETAQQAYGMRTMSADEIGQVVQGAVPRSSGNDAALEQARYDALSKAAASTLKAREEDPAAYVRQAFPSVGQAWQTPDQPGGFQAAVAASVAAQQQLGIANIKPLPKDVVSTTVGTFKDETLTEAQRIDHVAGIIMATSDPTQQRAIFEQMVEAGLPDMTEGAFVALSRGDQGAANRLFRAALIDPSKLPGKAPSTPAEIDEQVQSTLMDENQIGDLYYGLSDGSAENLVRAQRDSKLLNNAVNLRLRNGEELSAAVSGAAKDLYGDVKPVLGDGFNVNAQILLPSNEDEKAVLEGLAGVMPQVERALTDALAVPDDAPTADSTKAIFEATGKNYIANVLSEGYFRNAGDGYAFIDPFTGTAVPGPDGKALIFTPDQVKASRPVAPAPMLPTDQPRTLNENIQGEMQQQEDRVRKMYEGAQ